MAFSLHINQKLAKEQLKNVKRRWRHDVKKISSRHKPALLLRMQGLNYEQISEQLGVGVSTVENWFYRDATFRDAIEQFKQQYIDEITKTARERMQSAADQAMQTLIELLGSNNERVRLDAARDLLDRCCFKPEDKLELKGTLDTSVSKLDSILRQLKEE